jgi:perosamine synthetase
MFRALPPAGIPLQFADILAGCAALHDGDAAVAAFRDDVRSTFGVRHVFLASSGRAALTLLLKGLHSLQPERNVVALPAYTSFSVPSAVVAAGFRVALYDVDPETLSPVPNSLAQAVNSRTLAVVACHLFGYPCDLDLVHQVAAAEGALVVDDAAQAMGAQYKGKPVGSCGDAGLFSLSRGKNINAVDGGIIVTQRDDLVSALELLPPLAEGAGTVRLFFKALLLSALIRPSLYWFPRLLPFLRLGASVYEPRFPQECFTPFQAGIARRMLARLPHVTTGRRQVARDLMQRLAGINGLTLPMSAEEPVYLRLPFLVPSGLPVQESPLLGVVRSYPAPLSTIDALRPHLVDGDGSYPGAERLAGRLLTLPTHQFLTANDRKRLVASFSHYS